MRGEWGVEKCARCSYTWLGSDAPRICGAGFGGGPHGP